MTCTTCPRPCAHGTCACECHAEPTREVVGFVNLDRARHDANSRGGCVLFDVHGLWWSVPTELSIREVDAQIRATVDRFGGAPIDGTYRPVKLQAVGG